MEVKMKKYSDLSKEILSFLDKKDLDCVEQALVIDICKNGLMLDMMDKYLTEERSLNKRN